MRRAPRAPWIVLAGWLAAAGGCGPELPPPPTLKREGGDVSAGTTPEGGARSVYMVVPGPPDQDLELWAIAGQREAGDLHAVFRVIGPGPGEPALTQAKVIRDAVKDGVTALVVIPDGSADLPAALAEAEDAGAAIVTMGDPIAAPAGRKPFTRVVPGSFGPSARLVVEALQADARKLGLPADEGAILLVDRGGDRYSKDRVAALRKAAEAAGIKQVIDAPFEGGGDKVKVALLEAVRANPRAPMILCDDDDAMMIASRVRIDLERKPTILVGGYAGSRGVWDPNFYIFESAYVECRSEKLARLAVRTAIAKSKGEPTAEVVELEPKFARGRGGDESSWLAPRSPVEAPTTPSEFKGKGSP